MIFKRYEWRLVIRVLFLFITLLSASFVVIDGQYIYLFGIVPIILYQLVDMVRFQDKAQEEISQFVESIH
jgi:two-component system nitrogen regulation sensor histidine kinase NtrY